MKTILTSHKYLVLSRIRQYMIRSFLVAIIIMLTASGLAMTRAETSQSDENQPAASNEVIVEDSQKGYWLYEKADDGVRIEILRKVDEKSKVLWYEADLRFSKEKPLQFLTSNEENPGEGLLLP